MDHCFVGQVEMSAAMRSICFELSHVALAVREDQFSVALLGIVRDIA